MKDLHEVASMGTRIMLWILTMMACAGGSAYIVYRELDLTTGDIFGMLIVLLLKVLAFMIFMCIGMRFLCEEILGKPFSDAVEDEEEFATKYAITKQYVLTHVYNQKDSNRRELVSVVRRCFSYHEVASLYREVREQKWLYGEFEPYTVPGVRGAEDMALSRHTLAKLCKVMSKEHFLVLERVVVNDYAERPSLQHLISRKDIRYLRHKMDELNMYAIRVVISRGEAIPVNAQYLMACDDLISEDTEYIDMPYLW